MHAFEAHGVYLRDFDRADADLVRLGKVEEDEAHRLLTDSPWVTRNPHVTQKGLLLNKGFCVVRGSGDRVVIVYNHDGSLQLWLGSASFFKERFSLGDIKR